MSDNNSPKVVRSQHDSGCAHESCCSARESSASTAFCTSPSTGLVGSLIVTPRETKRVRVVSPIESPSTDLLVRPWSAQLKNSLQSGRRNLKSCFTQTQTSSSAQATPTSTRKRKRSDSQALVPQEEFPTPVDMAKATGKPTHFSRTTQQRIRGVSLLTFLIHQLMTSLIHQLFPNRRKAASLVISSRKMNPPTTVQGTKQCISNDAVPTPPTTRIRTGIAVNITAHVNLENPAPTSATGTSPPPEDDQSSRRHPTAATTMSPYRQTVAAPTLANGTNALQERRSANPPSAEKLSMNNMAAAMNAIENEPSSGYKKAATRPKANHHVSIRTTACNPRGGITLNAKQAQVVEAIKDKKNVFLTGPAGTGKSMVLKEVLNYCSKTYHPWQWVAVAPTGVTAIAIGGQTIHSFAGIGIPKEQADFNKAWEPGSREAWQRLKILVIDEISMIAGEFLDRLDVVVREIRDFDEPFGGIQVLICGDFLQLPPIVESVKNMKRMRTHAKGFGTVHGNRGFAFQSYFWKEANIETIHLTEVFRQDNPQFVGVLSRIRTGIVWEQDRIFLSRCSRPLSLPNNDVEPTRLYCKKVDVDSENKSQLAALDGDTHNYTAVDRVVPDPEAKCGAEEKLWNSDFFRQTVAENLLRLKIGAQVMLIKNDTLHRGTLVNGSRGVVVGFTKEKPGPPFNIPIGLTISDSNGVVNDDMYPIVKFQCGETRILGMTEFTSRIVGVGQCIRIAVPLKLAWAITVHKSQGMTLDYVKIDLAGVFCKAQAYVALSRAKDEKCLELRNFSPWLVKADTCALAFYDHPNIEIPNWDHREKWTRPRVKVAGMMMGEDQAWV